MPIINRIKQYKYLLILIIALTTSGVIVLSVFFNFENERINYEYEWLTSYGADKVDRGWGIGMDSEKNIYVSGLQDGGGPLCLLKYNINGSLLWNKTWGHGEAYDLILDNTDNIYITGMDYHQVCLVKYHTSGDVLINKTWGSPNYGVGYGIDLDKVGNIYITGYRTDYEAYNNIMILLKYNTSGDLIWNTTLGIIHSEGKDLIVDGLGDIYVTGYEQNDEGNLDVCLLKYNSFGSLEWERTWGGTEDDHGEGITLDKFGNVYVTGYKQISLNNHDLCLLKYDSFGNLTWAKTWGGDENDYGTDIKIDNSGEIYITGATGSFKENSNFVDILLAEFDNQGNCVGYKIWGAWSGTDYGFGLLLDDQGYAYITGTMISPDFNNFVDIFLLKYDVSKIPHYMLIPGYDIILMICIIGSFFLRFNRNKRIQKT
jgi:hypothetical protein